MTARKYLLELKEHHIDTLVMGCTHYPILRYTINKVMGEEVTLVNPAYETAKVVKDMLKEMNFLSDKYENGKYQFYVSDDPEKFIRIGGSFLKKEISSVRKINIEML